MPRTGLPQTQKIKAADFVLVPTRQKSGAGSPFPITFLPVLF